MLTNLKGKTIAIKNRVIYLPRFFVSSRGHRNYWSSILPRTVYKQVGVQMFLFKRTTAKQRARQRDEKIYCTVLSLLLS